MIRDRVAVAVAVAAPSPMTGSASCLLARKIEWSGLPILALIFADALT